MRPADAFSARTRGEPDYRTRATASLGYAYAMLRWHTYDVGANRPCPTPDPPVARTVALLANNGGTVPIAFDWNGCGIGAYPFAP